MSKTDVTSLLERDWQLVERLKTDFWIEQKAVLTPSAALQFGEEIRSYVRTVRPDWPDSVDRESDLATHIRVSEALRHAANHITGSASGSSS